MNKIICSHQKEGLCESCHAYQANSCCHKCRHDYYKENPPTSLLPIMIMILCPICGNKRCPKASNHDHACTNSNADNQHGSVYGDYRIEETS